LVIVVAELQERAANRLCNGSSPGFAQVSGPEFCTSCERRSAANLLNVDRESIR
jgi:hypothetical protein